MGTVSLVVKSLIDFSIELLHTHRNILIFLLLCQRAVCLSLEEVLTQLVCSISGVLTPCVFHHCIRAMVRIGKFCPLAEA